MSAVFLRLWSIYQKRSDMLFLTDELESSFLRYGHFNGHFLKLYPKNEIIYSAKMQWQGSSPISCIIFLYREAPSSAGFPDFLLFLFSENFTRIILSKT